MQITEPMLRARPVLVPLRPEVASALVDHGVFDHPIDKVVWASPQVATPVPGSALPSVPLAKLPDGVQLHPVKLSSAGQLQLAKALGIGEAVFPAAQHFVPSIPGKAVDSVAAVFASGEMLNEWIHPKHRSTLEGAMFWGAQTASVLNFASDFIPALHSAKPVFNGVAVLCQSGREVYAVMKPADSSDPA